MFISLLKKQTYIFRSYNPTERSNIDTSVEIGVKITVICIIEL